MVRRTLTRLYDEWIVQRRSWAIGAAILAFISSCGILWTHGIDDAAALSAGGTAAAQITMGFGGLSAGVIVGLVTSSVVYVLVNSALNETGPALRITCFARRILNSRGVLAYDMAATSLLSAFVLFSAVELGFKVFEGSFINVYDHFDLFGLGGLSATLAASVYFPVLLRKSAISLSLEEKKAELARWQRLFWVLISTIGVLPSVIALENGPMGGFFFHPPANEPNLQSAMIIGEVVLVAIMLVGISLGAGSIWSYTGRLASRLARAERGRRL